MDYIQKGVDSYDKNVINLLHIGWITSQYYDFELFKWVTLIR